MAILATIPALFGALLGCVLLRRANHAQQQFQDIDMTNVGRIMLYDKHGRYIGQWKP